MADRVSASGSAASPSGIDALIDRMDAVSARWHVVLAALSVAWFIASCADYAGFIDLPVILPLPGWLGILPAALWNAVWWGVAYPRIEARRAERKAHSAAIGLVFGEGGQ